MGYLKTQATLVKDMVSMPEVIHRYVKAEPIGKRVPCPLHQGEGYNLSFNEKNYKCWVCGSKGDVINFVQDLFGLSFPLAVEQLVREFNLPIPLDRPSTPQERQSAEERVNICLERQNRLNEALNRQNEAFERTLTEFAKYDRILCSQHPKSIEEMTPEYVEALQKIDDAWYKFQNYREIAEEENYGREKDRDEMGKGTRREGTAVS